MSVCRAVFGYMVKSPKHILVIRLSAMGDVAMTVPVLRAFCNQHPDVKLSVLTQPQFKAFFRDLNTVNIIEAQLKEKHKGFLGLLKLSKELRAYNFDAIADLHNVLRSTVLKIAFLGKNFSQIDKGRQEKKALVQGNIFQQLKSTVCRYADVFENLGYPITLENPSFPKQVSLTPDILSVVGKDTKKWIGIAPFAAHASKMYPIDKMKKVIRSLSKHFKILLFGGGKAEISILNQLQLEYENTISIAGKLSMDEELDVISNLDLMISMDSGNGHISAMLGIPTLTIWGVTHPFAGFAPYNQPKENNLLADRVKYPEIPTSVYGNAYPVGYEDAAGSISPESIIQKAQDLLMTP